MTEALSGADMVRLLRGVVLAVMPLALLFLIFQALFLRLPRKEVLRVLSGTAMASCGLLLFLAGVDLGFLPFGRTLGEALGTMPERWMLAPMGFVLGFVTTWGEPAVRILADQVEEASAGSIRRSLVLWTVSAGVAAAVGVGMLRIVYGIPLLHLLVPGYAFIVVAMWWSDREFVSVAIDAGGVATGPLANTFLLALALGASAAVGDQNPLVQGLGLVSLIALAPVMAIMGLGLLIRRRTGKKEL